jgi:gliding motility-associated-like protein
LRNIIAIAWLVSLSVSCFAQKESNTWYFGTKAGLDFSSGAPVAITNGQLTTSEGCATISNSDGVLKFYTDGITVYTKNHTVMKNGSGLMGNSSATQSAVVAPHPGDTSVFYIFTIDAVQNGLKNGLRYSIVDMRLDGGNGTVTTKNILLYTPSAEKVTAIKHGNSIDFWIISHRFGNDEFVAYKLTKAGLNLTPIISKVGTPHVGGTSGNPIVNGKGNSQGYLKASPKGDKIALAIIKSGLFELFDFDNKTGKLSNAQKSPVSIPGAYGVEFSPDGSKLYLSSYYPNGSVYQYDMQAPNIFTSRVVLTTGNTSVRFGAIQAGPDGKLYIARRNWGSIDVINNPNAKGTACDYKRNQIGLKGRTSKIGLPTFIQSYFRKDTLKCSFSYQGLCVKDSFKFFVTTNYGVENFLWDFGDNTSQNDTASGDAVLYLYKQGGTYHPKLLATVGNEKCEVKLSISAIDKAEIVLPKDTFVCEKQSITIAPLKYHGKVNWNTAAKDTFPTLLVDTAGIFIATNTNSCGVDKDTIKVSYKALPKISIQTESVVCPNRPFSASVTSDHKVIKWHDGKSIINRTFSIADKSILWVQSSNICGTSYDSVGVAVYPKLQFKINADSAVCPDVDFSLSATSNSDSVINWFNATIGKATVANIPKGQWVWALTKNQCVTKYDSAFIETYEPTTVDLGGDKEICDTDIVIDAGIIDAEYVWQDIPSYNTQTFVATKPGVYKVAATRCKKTVVDSITIYPPQDTGVYIPNAFTPNRDMVNNTFVVFIDGFAPKKYQLYIYSRWGEEIFKSDDYLQNWDGTFKGQDAPEGAYLYMLNLLHCNRIKRYKGSITLIR